MRLAVLFLGITLLLSLACTNSPQKTSITLAELETEIQAILSDLEGEFAVALKDVDSPTNTLLINQDERFHAASTMKTPVLIELYKQQLEGLFSVQDSIPVISTFSSIVDGSPFNMSVDEKSEPTLFPSLNSKMTIFDLAEAMITQSSNLATNVLINLVDAKNVTSTMRTLGADSIEVLRGVEDIKAFELGLSNTTTARDLLIIFEQLASGTLINEEANAAMIDILADQAYNDMIPAMLPRGTKVAHKTGWITGVHHDSGIVYTPNGRRYIMVFLSKNAPNRKAVLSAGAQISKLFYNFVTQSAITPFIDWKHVYRQQGLQQVDTTSHPISVELRYSTTNNFIGEDVYGSLDDAFLQPETVNKLYQAAELLEASHPGYKLLIYDAARPRRIQQVLWNSVTHIPLDERSQYVANPQTGSIHNYGCAIDLTVIDADGNPLDMGTDYDDFSQRSHTDSEQKLIDIGLLTQTQVDNRAILRNTMLEAGFTKITSEWWHFDAFPRQETKNRFKMVE